MEPAETNSQKQAPAASATDPAAPGTIDLQKLADKVYRLMLADLRLEQARGAPVRRRRRP